MISKIFVEFTNVSGQRVFRVLPAQPVVFRIGTPTENVSSPGIHYAANRLEPSSSPTLLESGFFLSPVTSQLLQASPATSLHASSGRVLETDHLKKALNSGAMTDFGANTVLSEQTRLALQQKEQESEYKAMTYTRDVIRDRIEYILKKNGVSREYAEPLFDVLYHQQLGRLYTDVYGVRYSGDMWLKTDLDKRIVIDLHQAAKVFQSFAQTRLGDGKTWIPKTDLERKMSGEWFTQFVDDTVSSIVKKGNLEGKNAAPTTGKQVSQLTDKESCGCPDVPDELRQAYLSTPDIDQFDPKSFEGLPALFELPRWDIERTYGLEPRLNKVDVDCTTMLTYDYPAVLAHRIKMLKAEKGPSRDIKILEDLKANIDKVLLDERYLNSTVSEANNTARFLALEGEKGLARAYENSVKSYVQRLASEPAVMKQIKNLKMPDNMAQSFFTLAHDPSYREKLFEAVEAYISTGNSNLSRYSGESHIAANPAKPNFKETLLKKVVASFGTKTS